MNLDALLKQISRPATAFEVGGFRPTNAIEESWIGRVCNFLPDEEVPLDKHGNRMMELGQFYMPAMPYVPASLSEVSLLTVFISPQLEGDSGLMDGCWLIREYPSVSALVKKEFRENSEGLKAFPLLPTLLEADHPVWDGGGLTPEQEDAFLALECDNSITNYYDVTSHTYSHKFGGYPSFCQSGVDLHPHEFVFQVASDSKIHLNVIDGGNLTFWRHPERSDWKLYYDFY